MERKMDKTHLYAEEETEAEKRSEFHHQPFLRNLEKSLDDLQGISNNA